MQDFKYHLEIVRAVKKKDGLYIDGIASNTSVDKYDTVFTEECQKGFVEDIKDAFDEGKPLQVEIEHEGDEAPFLNIGVIVDGKLNNTETRITARLDNANPLSAYYYTVLTSTPEENRAMGRPERLFFSIRGKPIDTKLEYNADAGKLIPHFYRVKLRRVGLTEKPVNDECFADAIVRSLGYSEEKLMSVDNNEQKKELETVVETAETETEEVRAEETTEVDTKVEVDENIEEKETETDTTVDEQTEVGSDQEPKEEEKEVVAEEGTSGETAVEAAETKTEEVVIVNTAGVKVEETRAENAVETDEVTRGELKDLVSARDISQKMSELNWAFTDTIYMVLYSGDENKVEKLRAVVDDYASLMEEIVSTKRALDTSDAALQKEDLDEKVELTYSLKERYAAKNADIVRALKQKEEDMNNQKLDEITRALDEIKSKLDEKEAEIETLRSEKETVENKNKELQEKVEELEKQPAEKPVVVAEKDEKVVEKKSSEDFLAELKKKGDKVEIAKVFLANKIRNF